MKHKLGICIPYRNREEHLKALLPHLSEHLGKQGIDYCVYVGHQVDDKLFNRGAMKNIAAEFAFRDGCDYVAFHDVDMLPNDTCDYSYPENYPIHIATKLSKYNYGLGYDQYFGGVVLFNKEHIEKTNGYSNEYWDWGQEDDDLFWRCYFEGYTTGKILKKYSNKPYVKFNGETSVMLFTGNDKINSCLSGDHTISILFKAEQQEDKVPIWLVGDNKKQFIEYPIFRKHGRWTYGMSFNNSRAVTMTLYDEKKTYWYNYGKRFEGMWTWVTSSFSKKEKNEYLYINNELVRNMNGIKENLPFHIERDLLKHDTETPFLIGYCNFTGIHFKGSISEIKIYNKFFKPEKIDNVFDDNKDKLVLHYDFKNDGDVVDNVFGIEAEGEDLEIDYENIEVIENILPYRKEGEFFCLPHQDEGYINGTWFKGETTARNERRLVTQMQQRKINYKTDGMNSLKYEVISTELNNKCLMINVKL